MRRALLVVPLALALAAGGSALLHAQEAPPRPGPPPVEQGRFQLQKMTGKEVIVFDSATGRIFVVNDLDVVSRIDPVAGTVLTSSMRFVDRDNVRILVRQAIEKGDAAALAEHLSRRLAQKHPDPAKLLAELEAAADAKYGGSAARLLEEAAFVFERGAWRLDE